MGTAQATRNDGTSSNANSHSDFGTPLNLRSLIELYRLVIAPLYRMLQSQLIAQSALSFASGVLESDMSSSALAVATC
ncbi:MAG: hypothetical protein AB1861_18665 [Cyanobacteriota bacterium]